MSEEMREQINKVKNFGKFINENKLNEMATSKKKIDKFLEELTIITKKYNIYLDTTDDMFLTDDSGDIGSIKYDYNTGKYIYWRG